ncbi:corticosteroid-binding globulin [Trichechus manatus latirostris]|uniref:Corticosteroid-binding globulin n=1 Tax=Trichechus manatus latirostris TaxID=127582 RepID=A0A2Y9DLK5_TRIMA|nr:corticosteroid-binding globulin [Trichechus manatus latirostris]
MLLVPYSCLLWLSTSGFRGIQAENPSHDVNMRSPHRGLAPANVDFAFSLYKHMVASAPGRNIFISPVSISMALAVLSLGAGGSTRTQLLQGLGFNLTETPEVEIHRGFQHLHRLLGESDTSLEMTMGNALFLDRRLELLESFSADTKHYYESEALATDFQDWVGASRQINEHVKNKTQGKIVDLFPELESPASLILVNYVFLKGTWAQPFDLESTSEEDFHVSKTTTVKVPMMFQSSFIKYLNDSVLPCQLVQLDYTGNGTVFFILPDKGEMDTVIAALSRDTIQRWSESLSLGAECGRQAPSRGPPSSLHTAGANRPSLVHAQQVVHKAVLHLEETGVKAAAAPMGGLKLMVRMGRPRSIKFNRPFIITVFDHFTWSSIFLGKFVSPT